MGVRRWEVVGEAISSVLISILASFRGVEWLKARLEGLQLKDSVKQLAVRMWYAMPSRS